MQQETSIQQGSVSIEENSRGHTISSKAYESTTKESIERCAEIAIYGLIRAKEIVQRAQEAARARQ